MSGESGESSGLLSMEETDVIPPHPYESRLTSFKPEEWRLKSRVPRPLLPLEDSKFILVDTQVLLDEMVARMNKENEVGVTLECHSYRTFHGICCLLQISTRTEDYIIDTIALKGCLNVLNEIFTDTNVLKVMHRATRDLEMLQKHLGLYVVNLFDTWTAGKLLSAQKALGSLADLVREYCSVKFDVDHQTSDWQIRPLPNDMVKYARQKVHYLLSAYDVLRNGLIEKHQISELYEECTKMCTVVWYPGKYRLTPTAYMNAYKKTKGTLNRQQLECFRLLFEWRYRTAESNDESFGYTLTNKDMFNISKSLPQKVDAIASCCTNNALPPLVKENLQDFHKLVLKAIENVTDKSSAAYPRERNAGGKRRLEGNENLKHLPKRGGRYARDHMYEGSQYPRGRGAPFRGYGPPFGGFGPPMRGLNASLRGRGGNGGRNMHYTGFSVMKATVGMDCGMGSRTSSS